MCDWSTYLLKRPIQVVAKNIWRDGQLEKMWDFISLSILFIY
jgi:hypothetical protein